MSRVLIGVTGSIAAYKAAEVVRRAIGAGHAVRVIQTPHARRFVGAATFAALTGAPVLSDEFEDDPLRGAYPGEPVGDRAPISHLALAQRADAYLIAPASAATIADLAGGHARSLVAAAALAADCPVLVAPAMNDRMYHHAATQANLRTLTERGVTVIGPGSGELASHGEHGDGRLSEPEELVAALHATLGAAATIQAELDAPDWLGRRVLVSAGGTREPIDSVRYIGNRSSGRMGYALADRAAARGAAVTLVAANVTLAVPDGVRHVPVSTAAQLARACEDAFADADVLLMAAAVADFRVRDPAAHKLKKHDGPPRLELEPTVDVLAALAGRRRAGQTLVGFAAEHGGEEPDAALRHARDKLARKHLDAIVLNDVSRAGIGFDAADNEVTVLTREGEAIGLARAAKERIADGILDVVARLWPAEEGTDVRGTDAGRPARV